MPLKILVTGASGYLGRQVCRHLVQAGHDVTGVARLRDDQIPGMRWIEADLLQCNSAETLFQTQRFDRLIHLAWTVEHGKFWTDETNLDWAAASLLLVRAAHRAGIEHVTIAGTCFEYDWPEHADCIEEVTPIASHTLYDTAKDATHRALAAFARQTGLTLAWVRLFHLYGQNEHPDRLIASVARALVAGLPAKTSSGQVVRDFMDVRDAGRAISTVSTLGCSGAINVASGQHVRLADLVRRMGILAERPDLINLGALPDRPEPPRITADVSRLLTCGFSPTYSLDLGLQQAIEYWRNNLMSE